MLPASEKEPAVATLLDVEASSSPTPPIAPPESKSKKATTAAFKVIPETRSLRDRIRDAAGPYMRPFDRSRPFTRDEFRAHAETFLKELGLGEQYLGFALVCLANEFWRDQVAAVPYHRRLMLVPHCLKNAEGCPAEYDEFGLNCEKCGACSVADFKGKAEQLGYKVLVSRRTPIVPKIIVSGRRAPSSGYGLPNVLEGVRQDPARRHPVRERPLHQSNCKNTSVDDDWVMQMIDLERPAPQRESYVT